MGPSLKMGTLILGQMGPPLWSGIHSSTSDGPIPDNGYIEFCKSWAYAIRRVSINPSGVCQTHKMGIDILPLRWANPFCRESFIFQNVGPLISNSTLSNNATNRPTPSIGYHGLRSAGPLKKAEWSLRPDAFQRANDTLKRLSYGLDFD